MPVREPYARGVRATVTLLLAVALVAGACAPAPAPSGSVAPGTAAVPSGAAAAPPPCLSEAAAPGDRPWWSDRVFYEVFVRSFQDSNGDGIGDLGGLIDRLDELDDLGITGLWLMPVAEATSYHGYDVTDYRAIESDYGTAEDFRALVAAAHDRGIAIVVDFVLNHTSIDHPWFQDSMARGEHADWYLWSDAKPSVARSDGTPVWHEAPDGRFYYGYFWEGMPDLNLENPAVQREIEDVAEYWLDEFGVDGFRLDAAKHLVEDANQLENTPETHEWLQAFRDDVHARHPEALILGEVFDSTTMSSSYVKDASLDLTFDFGLGSAAIISLNSRDAGSIAAALDEVAGAYPRDTLATFLTNHDQNRVMDQLGDDVESARLAAKLLLTGPGVPFVHYGEEIGMTGRKPDERIRTPMRWDGTTPAAGFSTADPWEPLSDDAPGVNVADEAADADSLLSSYRDLIGLRAGRAALAAGDLVPVESGDRHVVAFLRTSGSDVVLVVANLDVQPVESPSLTLDDGPLCEAPRASVLWPDGAGDVAGELRGPSVSATGGFEEYVPLEHLGPREMVVIELTR
ncbi:MAG TPA: alpha-amylase family glycosyl hydrolase [Candidatus Limnocylindrales bacterium]|nr:alpha-amylase family glycosyl hydrolase [Candidatus Limnocylindrales bacterium]